MKIPMPSMSLKNNTLSLGIRSLNIRVRGFGKWTSPKVGDESIWQGTEYWGETAVERIVDAHSQIEHNKNYVYICNDYNARQVSRQRLRLYLAKDTGSVVQKKTRPLTKEQKLWLYKNEGLDPWLTKAVDIKEVIEHPFLVMMRHVNPMINQADMWMKTEKFMGITGNCYWWKRKNRLGVPYQLWILETQFITPALGEHIDEFILGFIYNNGKNRVPFDVGDVVHHKYPSLTNKVVGMSPIEAMSDPISVNESIYKYERAQFKNMARPDIVIALDKDAQLGEPEFRRIKREWKKAYGGERKAGQMALLEGGAKIEKVSMTPRELSHLEGRRMTMEEIANGYGVPRALLSPDKSNLANARTAYVQYMRDTIDPKLKMYEQKMNEQVLPDYQEGENLFVAFDNCVPEDVEFILKKKESHLKTGYNSINIEKVKAGEDEVPWGNVPIMPAMMAPLGSAPPPKKELSEEELREIAEAVAKAMVKEIYK